MKLLKQVFRMIAMARRVGGWRMLTQEGPKQALLFQRLITDIRVPALAKAVLVGALVFAISPLNVPQYIPVIGALDDLGIALLAINFFLGHIPANILREHRQAVGLDPVSLED